jgi:hypothetical protein
LVADDMNAQTREVLFSEVLGTWSSQYATHVRYAVGRAGHEYAAHCRPPG